MVTTIVGRKAETDILKSCLYSSQAELVAVYGRRRVGKTYLIRNTYKKELFFEISGMHNCSTATQLENFATSLQQAQYKKKITVPISWTDAFQQLKHTIDANKNKAKKVLFFDELPWLDTRKSGFMSAFEHFWNTWASLQPTIIIVICGSAASWMIQKIINNRGGLHNRITKKIRLQPFTLNETSLYLQYKKVKLDYYQIIQLYMVMGGIPHYLNAVQPNKSAAQNIQDICFAKDGLLYTEFNNLFAALFSNASKHILIVKTLASKKIGLTRDEIIQFANIKTGGSTTQLLEELIESGFISTYTPLGKKTKETLYRLVDAYSLFYLQFIYNHKLIDNNSWLKKSSMPIYKIWCGYAFENICLQHIHQIKKVLGIEGVYTEACSWRGNYNKKGVQIDLLLDRNDKCIHVFEIKFYDRVFTITKPYATQLKNKIDVFKSVTQTNKTVFLSLVTTYGILNNIHYNSMVNQSITIENLFTT